MVIKRNIILSLLLFFVFRAQGQQVNFEDGFEDGDFIKNPVWSGDTDQFSVVNQNNNFLLQLTSSGAGSSYLTTPSVNTEGFWEFFVELDFSPSESNLANIFLMSDTSDLENGNPSGYAIKAGESGSNDRFQIVRFDGGTEASTVLTGTTDISSGGTFRVKITRKTGGKWALKVGQDYDGILVPEGGIQTDNTYTTTSHFGILLNYTSSRADKFFFDFKINLPPFTITDVVAGDDHVDVIFNRPCDQTTVQASDFVLNNGIGLPLNVIFSSPTIVQLQFSEDLSSNKYTLSVSNIDDQNGKKIASNTTAEFFIFDSFSTGDVVINEFMYDPPSRLTEYVELKNTTGKYLNLQDWKLGDQSGTEIITTDILVLEADGFLVVTADTSALFNTFGSGPYFQLFSTPSFNNSGDAVRLLTDTGILADSLFYQPEWGGEDKALERRSAGTSSGYRENWGNSPNVLAGTPGSVNRIAPDQLPPKLEELTLQNASTLRLIFSETVSGQTITSNFSIIPEVKIQLISIKSDSVTLFLSDNLQSGTTYLVTITNIEDIFGNELTETSETVRYLEFSTANKKDVVINEILYHPAGAEFVEIYNSTTKNFDLTGWQIGDGTGITGIGSVKLEEGQYLVLTGHQAFANSIENALYIPGFPSLNNSEDAVFIRSKNDVTIDSLFYSSDWGGVEGVSLERKDPQAASNDAANWESNINPDGWSAGVRNSIFKPDEIAPGVIFSSIQPDNIIEVRFNEFIKLTPNVNFILDGAVLDVDHFNQTNGNIIELRPPPAKAFKQDQDLSIQNLSDIRGNVTSSISIPVAQPMKEGNVVINEIMFNPLNESDDNRPDQTEYIELRNINDAAVSAEGFFLHDAPDENGEIWTLMPVSTISKWIPANCFLLIHADTIAKFPESKTAVFFEPVDLNSVRIDRSSLGLASSGDAIYLSDSTGTAIDSVYYDENWHNPNILDNRGISLERINPYGPGNNTSNWSSSTAPKGGTPGRENSIYQIPSAQPKQTGIRFSPNPFSPDNDGFEDNLFINYQLDEPGYLIKVRIFDRYGREVRELADGQPAGFEGSLIWDGLTDEGNKNRIGIYIVLFEAYNSTNGENRAFKEVVVLARRI